MQSGNVNKQNSRKHNNKKRQARKSKSWAAGQERKIHKYFRQNVSLAKGLQQPPCPLPKCMSAEQFKAETQKRLEALK